MFRCTKAQNKFIYFIDAFARENQRFINIKKPFAFFENCSSQIRLYGVMQSKIGKTNFLIKNYESRLPIVRNKSKSKKMSYKKRNEYESSDDEDEDDDVDDNEKSESENDSDYFGTDVQEITRSLKSMRVDLILKVILNINRKRVEDNFYQNKIRVNGKILHKKSYNAKIGDEIDMIYNIENFKLNTLKIERIRILNVEEDPDNDRIILKVLRFKSLIINNNSYEDEWRESIKED